MVLEDCVWQINCPFNLEQPIRLTHKLSIHVGFLFQGYSEKYMQEQMETNTNKSSKPIVVSLLVIQGTCCYTPNLTHTSERKETHVAE